MDKNSVYPNHSMGIVFVFFFLLTNCQGLHMASTGRESGYLLEEMDTEIEALRDSDPASSGSRLLAAS